MSPLYVEAELDLLPLRKHLMEPQVVRCARYARISLDKVGDEHAVNQLADQQPGVGLVLARVYDVRLGHLVPGSAQAARTGRAPGLPSDPWPIACEEDLPMALYIYQAAYTPESLAAQIKEPQDRIEAVRPALEAMGGKLIAGGYPFGEYDVLVLMEAPDDTTAASVALAVGAGGATKAAKTTRLLSGQEWIESLRKAQGSQYRPAQ
jgi:uncharacterized protein with GYD domain